ncbi:hypothetical protein NKH91_14645 [Mesorhizobium sp. M0894]|uniref:hypothetical protein n=1 Tax=unclassified Mesorhizobium TaxID=325217 RepID=UPI003339C32D
MSSAKRRINSTGRRRVARESIDIRMLEGAPGEPLKAKASLSLDDLGFPAHAAVSIEAYHRSSGMRFECGTVGALAIPSVLVLDQVDRSGSVLFRVKVVDNDIECGKILGSAERVQPKSEEDTQGRKNLFPILFRDLVDEVWKVEINPGDRPKLVINTRMPGFSHRLQQNALLQGLLLPAAFRVVLEKLVLDPDAGEDDDNGGWKEEWLQYCEAELGMSRDVAQWEEEERIDWIEESVRKFCNQKGFIKRIRLMEGNV